MTDRRHYDTDHCAACGDFLPCGESWLPTPFDPVDPDEAECRFMVAAYPTLGVGDTCGVQEHRHDEPTFGLARALAAMFQNPDPSDEQIGWFLEDAAAIVDDFDPAPPEWSIETREVSEDDSFNLDFAFALNGVEYVVQQSEWEPSHPVKRATWLSWTEEAESDA